MPFSHNNSNPTDDNNMKWSAHQTQNIQNTHKNETRKNAMSNDTVSIFSHKYTVYIYHHPIQKCRHCVLSFTHSTRLSYVANVNEISNFIQIVRCTVNEIEMKSVWLTVICAYVFKIWPIIIRWIYTTKNMHKVRTSKPLVHTSYWVEMS